MNDLPALFYYIIGTTLVLIVMITWRYARVNGFIKKNRKP